MTGWKRLRRGIVSKTDTVSRWNYQVGNSGVAMNICHKRDEPMSCRPSSWLICSFPCRPHTGPLATRRRVFRLHGWSKQRDHIGKRAFLGLTQLKESQDLSPIKAGSPCPLAHDSRPLWTATSATSPVLGTSSGS